MTEDIREYFRLTSPVTETATVSMSVRDPIDSVCVRSTVEGSVVD